MELVSFALALLVAAAGVWAWWRKRRAAACTPVRTALEQLLRVLDDGTHFQDHGAFSKKGLAARSALVETVPLVTDRRLKAALMDVVSAYDAARSAALPAHDLTGREANDKAPWMVALAIMDPTHPTHRLKAALQAATERVTMLQRRTAGLV